MINLKALTLSLLVTVSGVTPALAYTPAYPGDRGPSTQRVQPQTVKNCWFSTGNGLRGDLCVNTKHVDHEGDIVHTIRQGNDNLRVVLYSNGNASVSYNGGQWDGGWEWTKDAQGDYKVGERTSNYWAFAFTAARG